MSDTVRVCGPRAGYSPVKADSNILDGDFASRVKHHFATLLGFSADPSLTDDPLGAWWRDGYLLRNQVAHRGHLATTAEGARAVTAANVLLDDAIDRIVADPRFDGVLPPRRTSDSPAAD